MYIALRNFDIARQYFVRVSAYHKMGFLFG